MGRKWFNQLKFRLDCTEAQFAFVVVYTISIISPGFWAKTVCQIHKQKINLIIIFEDSSIEYWMSCIGCLIST